MGSDFNRPHEHPTVNLPDHLDLIAAAPAGIQKLRGLILELAVRGKLVPQDPNDEPASELLKRIAKEQARLQAEGTGRKSKATPLAGTEAWPFALPNGWQWSRVGDLSSVVRGVSYDKSQASDTQLSGFLPLLRGHNINQRLNFEDLVYVPAKLISEDQLIRRGDIVIAMSSGSAHLVGKAAQADSDVEFAFGAFCGLIRAYSMELYRYFGFFFQTPLYRNRVAGHGKGIGINNLQKGALLALECPVPPLAEQHRIVAKVDELMALCDLLEAEQADAGAAHAKLVATLLGTLTQSTDAAELAANWQRLAEHFDTMFTTESSLDALKQTILQLAVMGKLVPQDPNDEPASELLKRIAKERARLEAEGVCKKMKAAPLSKDEQTFEVLEGWTRVTLPDLCLIGGGATPSKEKSAYWGSGIPWVSPKDMKVDQILDAQDHVTELALTETSLSRIANGSLLVVVRGMILVHSFPVALTRVEVAINQDMKSLTPFRSEILPFLALACKGYKKQILGLVERSTHGTCKLQSEKLSAFLFGLPPLAEQHRIVAKVDELLALVDRLKAGLAESRAQQERLSTTLIESALKAA
jgi:type I restriction enzyme S subunit